jgi:hypothetical protein
LFLFLDETLDSRVSVVFFRLKRVACTLLGLLMDETSVAIFLDQGLELELLDTAHALFLS